jgi:hypothetical protein
MASVDTVKFRMVMRLYPDPLYPLGLVMIEGPGFPPPFEIIEEKPNDTPTRDTAGRSRPSDGK